MHIIRLRRFSSIGSLLRVFIMNGCILSNEFSASIDRIMWFFFFSPLIFLRTFLHFLFFKRFYLFIFRGEGREIGRETSMCGCLSHAPPSGDLAHNPGMCPDWELNQ